MRTMGTTGTIPMNTKYCPECHHLTHLAGSCTINHIPEAGNCDCTAGVTLKDIRTMISTREELELFEKRPSHEIMNLTEQQWVSLPPELTGNLAFKMGEIDTLIDDYLATLRIPWRTDVTADLTDG